MDTVENVARYIGRKLEAVRPEIEDLVEAGILEKRVLNDKPIYSLTTNETIRTLVEQFVLACEDRFFRVKAVACIIKGIRQVCQWVIDTLVEKHFVGNGERQKRGKSGRKTSMFCPPLKPPGLRGGRKDRTRSNCASVRSVS